MATRRTNHRYLSEDSISQIYPQRDIRDSLATAELTSCSEYPTGRGPGGHPPEVDGRGEGDLACRRPGAPLPRVAFSEANTVGLLWRTRVIGHEARISLKVPRCSAHDRFEAV